MNILESVLKNVFKKTYAQYKFYEDRHSEMSEEIRRLKYEFKDKERKLNMAKIISERGEKVLHIYDNGTVAYKNYEGDIVLTKHSKVHPTNYIAKISCEWNNERKRLYITDNWANPINKGLGSMAMEELLKEAEVNDIEIVRGWLSPRDTTEGKHGDLLRHFYKKHGFKIVFEKDKEMVVKNLKQER